jgi:hypothetical protein
MQNYTPKWSTLTTLLIRTYLPKFYHFNAMKGTDTNSLAKVTINKQNKRTKWNRVISRSCTRWVTILTPLSCMESRGSSPCSQKPATILHPELPWPPSTPWHRTFLHHIQSTHFESMIFCDFMNFIMCDVSLSDINLRTALFGDITQRPMVILYRCFGTTYRSHLQGSISPILLGVLDPWRWDRYIVPKRR